MAKSKGLFGGGGRDQHHSMDSDDQAYLDQIEQNIRGKDNEQADARREAEQRAREMERIRTASLKIPGAGKSKATEPAPSAAPKKNPLENDPRYKEYFERLKRQKGETSSAGPESSSTAPAPSSPTPRGTPTLPARSDSQVVGPGAIVRFDDGSIGVYKDAVSGRDYALFYFLQPDGQFVPQGVFLQSYQAKVIGNLPENYFADLRDKSTWDRDLILYHLTRFEHVEFLANIAEHEERKPKASPAKTAPAESTPTQIATPTPAPAVASAPQPSTPTPPPPASHPTPTSSQGLVKGRRFKILFSGKMWEAVYWTSDDQGAIVAHSTHGNWSLMRLDLDRFKDSMELGEIVDAATMEAIAENAAASK